MTLQSETRRVTARSADGTELGVTVTGDGPPLVLVEPAGHHRAFSAFDGLVEHLQARFAVVTYDRRGRGDSGDTPPYAVEAEVADLAAVIGAVRAGQADVYGVSSGALLAIQGAVHGAPIRRLALFEPPLDEDVAVQAAFTSRLRATLQASGDDACLEFFLASILPAEMLDGMRGGPEWTAMAEVAPTLVYDCVISEATGTSTLQAVQVPTLVLASEGSSEELLAMARTVAQHIPRAHDQSLPGDWHGADPAATATALTRFLLEDDDRL